MWSKYKKYTIFIVLGAIFFLALFLRTFNLSISPPGFTWDEASWGYNAYSILKTGKDEYGTFMPLIFKAFGDYKFGTYIYADVPFVALFGLTETAVRLPAILAGSMIPIVAYFVFAQLAPNKKNAGILIALLLSISPWTLQYSRGAWESSLSFLFTLLGVLFLLKARNGKKKFFIFSILFFALTIYTYQSAKILSTGLLIGLLLMYRESFFQKKTARFFLPILAIFVLVLLSSFASKEALSRLVVLNQLNYHRSDQELSAIKKEENSQSPLQFQLFHSEGLEYVRTVSSRYINYFSPHFLFVQGGADGRQGVLGYGMMHLFEFPFLLLGLYALLRLQKKQYGLIILWAALAPIAAATSRDLVNTDRTLTLIFPLECLVGMGMYEVLMHSRKKAFIIVPIIVILAIFNVGYYFDRLFIHSRIHTSADWQYGHKEAVEYVAQNKDKYNKVVFTTKYNEPYIFYLFYTRYDPATYQKQAHLVQTSVDVGEVPKIDNIEFRPLYWPHDRSEKNNLYVGAWLEIPDQDIDPKQSHLLKTIYNLDHTIAFKIAETKP